MHTHIVLLKEVSIVALVIRVYSSTSTVFHAIASARHREPSAQIVATI